MGGNCCSLSKADSAQSEAESSSTRSSFCSNVGAVGLLQRALCNEWNMIETPQSRYFSSTVDVDGGSTSTSSASEAVHKLFSSPNPGSSRISEQLGDKQLGILGDGGRVSSDFCAYFSKSLSDATVSATMAEGSKQVKIRASRGGTHLSLNRLIGRGGYGCIFVGEWEDREVAVKVVANRPLAGMGAKERQREVTRQRMLQMEAIIMTMVDHENVVHTYKVVCGPDELPPGAPVKKAPESMDTPVSYYMVMEYARLGSLWTGLVRGFFHNEARPWAGMAGGLVEWDAWAAIETLKEAVRGLMYLHQQGIIHGDMKAANVLLCTAQQQQGAVSDNRGFVARITDFGLSRINRAELQGTTSSACGDEAELSISPRHQVLTTSFGTVTHMPPELLSEGLLTPEVDVYSFGVLMWEMYTALAVYQGLSDKDIVHQVVHNKLTPSFPADTPPSYRQLAEDCWSSQRSSRPSLELVLQRLVDIQEGLCPLGADSPGLIIMGSVPNDRRRSMPNLLPRRHQAPQVWQSSSMYASSPHAHLPTDGLRSGLRGAPFRYPLAQAQQQANILQMRNRCPELQALHHHQQLAQQQLHQQHQQQLQVQQHQQLQHLKQVQQQELNDSPNVQVFRFGSLSNRSPQQGSQSALRGGPCVLQSLSAHDPRHGRHAVQLNSGCSPVALEQVDEHGCSSHAVKSSHAAMTNVRAGLFLM